ncbi:hypothetical protein [Rhizobium binxianense]
MRRKIIIIAGILIAGLFGPAQAADAGSRYYCSADDSHVRFTLESGFDDDEGHGLNHFRGALMIKDPTVSPAFEKRIFGSDHLTNRWSRDGDLRLEVFDGGGKDTGGETLDLVVVAAAQGKAQAFGGTYALEIGGDSEAFNAEGKVSCGTK